MPEPLPTDEQSYFGAGVWRFAAQSGRVCTMEGSYWTNRAWREGLNTAGNAVAQADCAAQTTPALVYAATDPPPSEISPTLPPTPEGSR